MIFSLAWNTIFTDYWKVLGLNFLEIGLSDLQKVQTKNFSVISKYHFSINFLAQKKTLYPI